MKAPRQDHRGYGFVLGLAAGTLAGAALAMWFAPRASELGERIADSARSVRRQAPEQYQEASARVGDAVDVLTRPRAL